MYLNTKHKIYVLSIKRNYYGLQANISKREIS